MHSKNVALYYLRKLLFPLAWLYGIVIYLRNSLYDHDLLSSKKFPVPVICVGNLSTGGTGKTPMILYLLALLTPDYQLATLSRGYKRKTKGFILAGPDTSPDAIGDEPYIFHNRFPGVCVSVGEDRAAAINRLLQNPSKHNTVVIPEVILLDDGYQHRSVTPGLSIILTDYHHRFSKDYLLPVGNLRDTRSAAKRAGIIVVTKCPKRLSENDKIKITRELSAFGPKSVFFSHIQYNDPISVFSHELLPDLTPFRILLIHGIAQPESLRAFAHQFDPGFKELAYPDHHDYTLPDIQTLRNAYLAMADAPRVILTTEKDAVKLKNFKNALTGLPLYILPIQNAFLFKEQVAFDRMIKNYLQTFK